MVNYSCSNNSAIMVVNNDIIRVETTTLTHMVSAKAQENELHVQRATHLTSPGFPDLWPMTGLINYIRMVDKSNNGWFNDQWIEGW